MRLLVLLIVLFAPLTVQAAELIMFEQKGCVWCRRFDREVAPAYEKTEEGKRAPLRRVDIDKPQPPDLAFVRRERFTPVFVLVDNGREVGRIRGYPGDTFFWGLLANMLEKLDRNEPTGPPADLPPPRGATFGE
jgi:thioredoxin-related protein